VLASLAPLMLEPLVALEPFIVLGVLAALVSLVLAPLLAEPLVAAPVVEEPLDIDPLVDEPLVAASLDVDVPF